MTPDRMVPACIHGIADRKSALLCIYILGHINGVAFIHVPLDPSSVMQLCRCAEDDFHGVVLITQCIMSKEDAECI